MKITRLIAAAVAATLLAAGAVACGQPEPADYPAPTTWTVAYQGQSYCGYQYDAHEVDMYGTLICTRVRYPSATDTVIAGTLAAAMLLYLETYDGFYHSGYWYDRFYAPLGPRYHVTVVQRTTVINNFHTFDSRYAGDIKTNSAKAAWTGGKKGNYTFPTSNTKGKTGPLTNTNIATTGGRAAGDAGSSRTTTTGGSSGKTGTKPGTSRVGGRR